jgi:hypothetical protein
MQYPARLWILFDFLQKSRKNRNIARSNTKKTRSVVSEESRCIGGVGATSFAQSRGETKVIRALRGRVRA